MSVPNSYSDANSHTRDTYSVAIDHSIDTYTNGDSGDTDPDSNPNGDSIPNCIPLGDTTGDAGPQSIDPDASPDRR